MIGLALALALSSAPAPDCIGLKIEEINAELEIERIQKVRAKFKRGCGASCRVPYRVSSDLDQWRLIWREKHNAFVSACPEVKGDYHAL